MCWGLLSVPAEAFVCCIDLPRGSNLLIDLSHAATDVKVCVSHNEIS